jgi:putative MATE family efflux protein
MSPLATSAPSGHWKNHDMSSARASESDNTARFVTGSTMRHVIVMAMAGAVGLMTVFLVDLANLFYISLLGDAKLTAALGFATTILFFFISMSVGLMIAGTALVSRALGAGDRARARQLAGSAIALFLLIPGVLAIVTIPFSDALLTLLGAQGETKAVAASYLNIVLPSTALLGGLMGAGGILRAVGDARRSMYLTLLFGLTTAVLDPVFIFGFGWGVPGAAVVQVIARLAAAVYAIYLLIRVHDLLEIPSISTIMRDFRPLFVIGGPAILTNIATPIGNGYVTASISEFGDSAVAGWTIISRLIPVAFAALFSLSGAIGPILGQNFGAGKFDRVRGALTDALKFGAVYLLGVSLVLYLLRDSIVWAFSATGETAELVIFFCTGMALIYGFMAGVFVANAAFNNLGYPLLSTAFNWGRATLGTVPFVIVGASYGGAKGAIAGFSAGSVPFGIAAVFACYWVIARVGKKSEEAPAPSPAPESVAATGGTPPTEIGDFAATIPADRPLR